MKINSVTHGVIDTDKLPDGQAELAETVESFKKFVRERNGEFFIWVKVPGKLDWASVNLKTLESVASTVQALDTGISHASGGGLGVVVLPSNVIQSLKDQFGGES